MSNVVRREVANYRDAYSRFQSLVFLLKQAGLESVSLDVCLKLLNACRCASYEDCQAKQGLSVRSEVVVCVSSVVSNEYDGGVK